jgi:hypothetical protein
MKKFALYFSPNENPTFVEGDKFDIKRKPDGLRVTVFSGLKKKQVFERVTIFCEVSEKIKVA